MLVYLLLKTDETFTLLLKTDKSGCVYVVC